MTFANLPYTGWSPHHQLARQGHICHQQAASQQADLAVIASRLPCTRQQPTIPHLKKITTAVLSTKFVSHPYLFPPRPGVPNAPLTLDHLEIPEHGGGEQRKMIRMYQKRIGPEPSGHAGYIQLHHTKREVRRVGGKRCVAPCPSYQHFPFRHGQLLHATSMMHIYASCSRLSIKPPRQPG